MLALSYAHQIFDRAIILVLQRHREEQSSMNRPAPSAQDSTALQFDAASADQVRFGHSSERNTSSAMWQDVLALVIVTTA